MWTKKPIQPTKGKKAPRVKYDWSKIKIEFFKSEFEAVAPFFRQNYDIDLVKSGAVQRRVKGWQDEKNEIKKKWVEDAKKIIAKNYVPTLEELSQMHQITINLVKVALQKEMTDCITVDLKTGKQTASRTPDVALIEKLWRIIKAEKLEPTAVNKNENTISDEGRNALSRLLRENIGEENDEM